MADRVECDHCGLKVRIRKDGTYPPHEYTQYRVGPRGGVVRGSRNRKQCEKSGKPYAFHMGTFHVTKRGSDGKGTEWGAFCRCGEQWFGPDYDDVEKPWIEHSRQEQSQREPVTVEAAGGVL